MTMVKLTNNPLTFGANIGGYIIRLDLIDNEQYQQALIIGLRKMHDNGEIPPAAYAPIPKGETA